MAVDNKWPVEHFALPAQVQRKDKDETRHQQWQAIEQAATVARQHHAQQQQTAMQC